VGSPWLIAAMAGVQGNRRVGWEANGGFLTFSPIERSGRTLAPLPTRDAVLPILACLHAAAEKKSSLGALLALLPQRFTRAGLLDNVPVEETARLMRALHPENDAVTSAVFSAGKVTAWDATETELVLAPSVVLELAGIQRSLARHFDEARGFSPIARLNFLDGIRIDFENGDVAHIRPSGNAPQLRLYAQASTEVRAKAIVDAAIADPSGLLRALLADAGATTS
jgi:phosphomannomutase